MPRGPAWQLPEISHADRGVSLLCCHFLSLSHSPVPLTSSRPLSYLLQTRITFAAQSLANSLFIARYGMGFVKSQDRVTGERSKELSDYCLFLLDRLHFGSLVVSEISRTNFANTVILFKYSTLCSFFTSVNTNLWISIKHGYRSFAELIGTFQLRIIL